MHIKKFSAMICVLAIASGTVKAQATDNDVQAKARELVRQKEAQLNGQPAPTTAPADTVPAPAQAAPAPVQAVPTQEAPPPVPAPAPTVATPAPASVPNTTAPTYTPGKKLTPAEQEAAREAMRKAIADLDAKEGGSKPAPVPAPVMVPETKAQKKAEANMAAGNPAASVPAAVYAAPGSKQARLYELLQRYERDEISPTEYHEARAKIIAEP